MSSSQVNERNETQRPLHVALVGCGAVTERSHLPVLCELEEFSIVALVDRNLAQAKRLAEHYAVPFVCADVLELDNLQDAVDIAVVATPAGTHFEVGAALLNRGCAVLMEKPLCSKVKQAETLVRLAQEKQQTLAVSLVRRYAAPFAMLKDLLAAKVFGEVKSFSVAEGGEYNWPVQSADFYHAERSGGGVLLDHGAHLLDACVWWFGPCEVVAYQDDYAGGVEADCAIELELANGARGKVHMSRLRQLENQVSVQAERGAMHLDLVSGEIHLQPRAGVSTLVGAAEQGPVETLALFKTQYALLATALLRKNTDAARSQQQLGLQSAAHGLVTGDASLASLRLIEQCYQSRATTPIEDCAL